MKRTERGKVKSERSKVKAQIILTTSNKPLLLFAFKRSSRKGEEIKT